MKTYQISESLKIVNQQRGTEIDFECCANIKIALSYITIDIFVRRDKTCFRTLAAQYNIV